MHSNPLSNLCMHTWRCGDVAEGLIGRIILVLLYLLRSLDDSGPCDPVMVYLSLEASEIAWVLQIISVVLNIFKEIRSVLP